MNKYVTLLIMLLAATVTIHAALIRVATQQEFDKLGGTILSALAASESVVEVQLSRDTFYYKENHINLAGLSAGRQSLVIHGGGAVLIGKGRAYKNNDIYTWRFDLGAGFVDLDGGDAPLWGDLLYADGLVEIVDEAKKLCAIPSTQTPDLAAALCGNVYVCLTQWFKSNVYKVSRIEGGKIYFTANDLAYNQGYKHYSVNLDMGYGKQVPRFRLCNLPTAPDSLLTIHHNRIHLPGGVARLYECRSTRFLNVNKSRLASVEMDGLTFLGNKDSRNGLLHFLDSRVEQVVVRDCKFEGVRSVVLRADTTDNVSVSRCRFNNCYRDCVVGYASSNFSVTDNVFCNMGLACNNTFCVRGSGESINISNNEIRDFGYGAIAVGTWWASPKTTVVSGRVSGNHIYFTPSYMAEWAKRLLMDSGAIYLYTQNDDMEVCCNFIHDYTGAHHNCGIFCDDGTLNFNIHTNIILNTPNSYSIDSRSVLSTENNPRSHTPRVNINNRLTDNIVDGSIRFEGRDIEGANCHFRNNVLLLKAGSEKPVNTLRNLATETPMTAVGGYGFSYNRLVLPPASMSVVRKLRDFGEIERFVTQSSAK